MDPQPAVKVSARQGTRAHPKRLNGAPNGVPSGRPVAGRTVPRPAEPAGPPICALPLPQQIADHLGHDMMNGQYVPGSRLKEEQLAARYRVSRGPVREAFRILERRGFVEIVPRHGARVRAFDPADLAALFSVRAVLLGLAARQATEHATPELIERLAAQVARLRRSAETMDISPREHALIAGDSQRLLAEYSGNRPLLKMLEELTGRALWRMAWCETPLDFTTRSRRQQSARFWTELLRAVKEGDAGRAERTGRALLEASRDHMLATMAAQRGEAMSASHAASQPEEAEKRPSRRGGDGVGGSSTQPSSRRAATRPLRRALPLAGGARARPEAG